LYFSLDIDDDLHHIHTMASSVRQSVTLTTPQLEFLKREAERLGITVSDLIRRIIDRYREREPDA
jgi:Ribbon-helix-helix protein, copG family